MKKILLPVITLFLIGLGLVSCKDSSNVKKLLFIDVTPSPTDYVFSEGDIVKEHLIVKGLYSDGSEKTLSKESYSTNLTDDKVTSTTDKVTVTYQSKTKTIPISVRTDSKTLISIDVTSDKYVFDVGEEIKPHLTVKGLYSDGSEQIISNTDYTVFPTVVISTTDKVTVTYQSKTKTIPITVGRMVILNDIEVTVNTDKLYEGDNIKDHLTVKGVYSDGIKTISKEGYSTNLPNDKVTSTSTSVTITYTDGGEKQTKSIPITLGDLSDYDIDNSWNTYLEGVDKSNVFSISFVKGKPSDVTESVGTYHRLSFYKKDNDLYVVGDRRIRFPSRCRLIFEDFPNVEQINFTNVDTSNVTDMSCMFMFEDSSNLTSITFGDNFDTSNVTDVKKMFSNCKSLETINISSFDTSKVTDMEGMFEGCEKLTSITFGNNFVTPNVTDMSNMFFKCFELTSLDLSKFDTSKVTTMKKMFDDCFKLTSITFGNNFVTPNVTDMSDMFWSCELLTSLNLSSFDTSKVTTMKSMFSGCKKLTSITFGNDFVTPNVTDMSDMFFYCEELTELNLSRFVVSDTTVKSDMFDNCGHNGTTVTINPTYESESFFNGTELGNTTVWDYSSPTYTHK